MPKTYNRGDEFTSQNAINEHNNSVESAGFKDVTAGIQGLSATIKLKKVLFLKHAKEFGYVKKYSQPTADQLAFWLYVYFQGEGRARKYLKSNGDYKYITVPPANMQIIKRLALERVASWRYVKSKNLFTS